MKTSDFFKQSVIEEEHRRIASLIEQMPFGDTSASFASWIRQGAVSNSIEDHTKGENDVAIPNT